MRPLLLSLFVALLVGGCDTVSSENAQLSGDWLLRRADINQRVYRLDITQSGRSLEGDAEPLMGAPDSLSATGQLTGVIDGGDVRFTIAHPPADTVQFDGVFTSDDEPGYAVEGDLRVNGVAEGRHYLQRTD